MVENNSIDDFIKNQGNNELWLLFGAAKCELKKRNLIRTSNIVGERGEQLAIDFYTNTPNLPKLQAAPESTQNIDAISMNGERYSVKTITQPGKTTGVFYGLNPKGSKEKDKQKFEFLLVVILDKQMQPVKIIETPWDKFCELKKWHSRMNAWNISLTKEFMQKSKIILDEETKNAN
jgi:hypothetical protein